MNAVMKLDPAMVRYEAMCTAIAECHRVDEVKDIRDKARALEVYAKQAMNVEAERKATEVRLRAERRTGELLSEMQRADKPNPHGTNQHSEDVSDAVTQPKSEYAAALESTGISRQTAHRYQQLASVPAAQFERHLKDPESKPTSSGIIRAQNGAQRMDDGCLWVWGRLRDFERDSHLHRNPHDVFGGMTESMQADVRRILPAVIDWLTELHEVAR